MLEFSRDTPDNKGSMPRDSTTPRWSGIVEVVMAADPSFEELMARVRAGDDAAETLVFRRYARRLVGLAARQFDGWMRDRIDVEDAVLSACKSFFLRCRRDAFELADWDELWSILAMITLRKCSHRREHARAARRDIARELRGPEAADLDALVLDRGPTPEEAAMLSEMVEQLFSSTEPVDRPIVEQILMGYTAEEVADRCDCSVRTVGRVRQRARQRLLRQLAS
jgi:DNA-directed RNA polymerase specialized sigma24 family protein